jgi:putative colanic acid biosysnthesis UDP-glucose lipid carrier transferase
MFNRSSMLRSTESPVIIVFNRVVAPFVVAISLLFVSEFYLGGFDSEYALLACLGFLVASQAFAQLNLLRLWRQHRLGIDLHKLLVAWMIVVGVLLFLGYATKTSEQFSRRVLLTWIIVSPIAVFTSQLLFRWLILKTKLGRDTRNVVIVGAGELGHEFAQRIVHQEFAPVQLWGFFDDRDIDRLPSVTHSRLAGTLGEVAAFVREHKVNSIYITLPMATQPRTMKLLDELQDTTASIYFVPDVRRFGMAQTFLDEVGDMPVIAVCETPFQGTNGLIKRIFDFSAALVLLMLLAPLMLTVALGVRLSSPGRVFFKQRRYGLDGDEIMVYKFRTMTVWEDGKSVLQATRNDSRVTPFGRFLRKTSLDELPQLFNVLQGRMSLVGPRPHAVAHNEMYRKLIKGYMLRHKVKPGITGWAQIHGLRGETETVEKMQARVQYDMHYIRNWSVFMDMMIVLRTVSLIYRDPTAH